ncbi:TPA: hypothetical protein N0F65_004315 [Lagenidium giganteum]|uniref:Leucine-rich repeat-containing N-terminal plant-type domain-containing protein n=1 Tax=Lagenidium giganteum TaxID=4803 RepID=A0AAV2ZBS0_9STRA|nr:TPA: hypothetical protein N0F65_004315 [Lagenidium giganteum]
MLYWSTEGPHWRNQWDIQNEQSDPCIDKWYGITCNDQGSIISIRLSNNNLLGFIPPYFARAKLSQLMELDLSSNSLTGSVPPTLSILIGLRVLRLDDNQLNGLVPRELAQLQNLRTL